MRSSPSGNLSDASLGFSFLALGLSGSISQWLYDRSASILCQWLYDKSASILCQYFSCLDHERHCRVRVCVVQRYTETIFKLLL